MAWRSQSADTAIEDRRRAARHPSRSAREGAISSSYAISAAKSQDGFVIAFRPGEAFFEDYERFYRRRRQGELQFDYHGDQRETSEPLRVAYLFASKRFGSIGVSPGFATSRDVATGRQFLRELPLSEMPSFIDYALSEARKTKFDVQTLSGIRQYMTGYLAAKRRRELDTASERQRRARQRLDEEALAYDRDRRAKAEALFDALPLDERAAIEMQARSYGAGLTSNVAKLMLGRNKVRAIIERYGDKLMTFDEWRKANRAA